MGPHRDTLILNIDALAKLPLKPFELCTLYILLFLKIRHPKNWLQRKSQIVSETPSAKILDLIPASFELNEWEKNKLQDVSILDLYTNFNLKGIPEAVNRTMVNWIKAQWNIVVLTHIPSPRELLKLQTQNSRCITLTMNHDEIDRLVLAARDPLSFVLHDLHHADCFFNQKETQKGQLGFFSLVEKIYDQPLLKNTLKEDKQFKSEFDYVVSDMNAYVIHLFKCFKSAFTRSDEAKSDPLFLKVLSWWDMPEHVALSAERLNTPDFKEEDELHLKNFFESSQEILV